MRDLAQALRDMATYDCGYEEQSDIAVAAADTIDRLTAENAEKQKLLDKWCSGEDHFQEVTEQLECVKSRVSELKAENANLTERLAAAVGDLHRIASCDACKHYDADKDACGKPFVEGYKCFIWRGEESE